MKKQEAEEVIRSHRVVAWTEDDDQGQAVHYGEIASREFYGRFPRGEVSSNPATIRGVPVPNFEPRSPVKDAIAIFPARVSDIGDPVIDWGRIILIRARDIQAMTSFAGRHDLTQGRR